jgi:hypothetical protein
MKSLFIILVILCFCYFNLKSIFAHEEIRLGNITVGAGWTKEPPLLNTLNQIVISISENDNPVRNALKDMTVSIQYGGISKQLSFVPSEESPGIYTAEIIPSKTGTYYIYIDGQLKDQKIKTELQIEDVEDAKQISFPPAIQDTSESTEIIGKQIKPIISDVITQIDNAKKELNLTNSLLQEALNKYEPIQQNMDKVNFISYIAVGLGTVGILLFILSKK